MTEKKYIEVDCAIEYCAEHIDGIIGLVASNAIKKIPTADVAEVKHGKWIKDNSKYDQRDNFYECSVCGRSINVICGDKLNNYPYCHCGARMDGDKK